LFLTALSRRMKDLPYRRQSNRGGVKLPSDSISVRSAPRFLGMSSRSTSSQRRADELHNPASSRFSMACAALLMAARSSASKRRSASADKIFVDESFVQVALRNNKPQRLHRNHMHLIRHIAVVLGDLFQ